MHTPLRRQGQKHENIGSYKDSRGIIKTSVSIDQRPEIVAERDRLGTLEVDLITGEHDQ